MNLQLADSNPAIKKYIMEAYALRTGNQGTERFLKALSNREVSIGDVLTAYKNAAQSAGGRVEEFANTVAGAEARFANLKFEEQLSRTMSEEVLPSYRKLIEAQTDMHIAMTPFRDMMYEASAATLQFTSSLLSASAPYINKIGKELDNSNIVRDKLAYMPEINPLLSFGKYLALTRRHIVDKMTPPEALRLNMPQSFVAPMKPTEGTRVSPLLQSPEVRGLFNSQDKEELFRRSTTTPTPTTFSPTVNVGGINVTSTATDAAALQNDIEGVVSKTIMNSLIRVSTEFPVN